MTNTIRQRWRTLTPWQRTFLSAGFAIFVGWWLLLVPASRPRPFETSVPEEAPVTSGPAAPVQVKPAAPQAPSTAPTVQAPVAPPQAPVAADALSALRTGLASDNSGTRIEALRSAADQGLTQVLPELLARDLPQDPELAPTLIQVSAQLAQRAEPQQRTAALGQLTSWLQAEQARDADAARGNVSVLVETLAKWNGQEVVPVLSETLHSERIPLHVQTVAAQGLGRLRAASAREELTRFRARIAQSAPRGGFELELQQEALQAADRALARLPAQ